MKNIFLTGEIQVGKSTAINRALAAAGPKVEGFRTLGGPWDEDGGSYVHMVPADGTESCNDQNRVFYRKLSGGNPCFQVFTDVFETRGPALLKSSPACELLLMDEIGIREAECSRFHDAILQALEGEIPVLGVVQIRPGGFLDEIRNHPSVELITVNTENREQVFHRLTEWMLNITFVQPFGTRKTRSRRIPVP